MSLFSKKRFAAALLVGAALIGLTACTGQEPTAESQESSEDALKLNVQYSIFSGPLNRAAAANIQPEGVEVTYVNSATGTVNTGQGLVTGAWDLAQWGDIGPVTGFANGADLRVIGSTDSNGAAHIILVGPDSTAETIADLKGGTVYAGKLTNAYVQFLREVEKHGLSESDFTVVESISDPASALIAGELDAFISIEPQASHLIETKGLRELSNGEGLIDNFYTLNTTQQILDDPDKHRAIELFLAALREHFDAAEANAEQEAEDLAALNGVSVAAAAAGLPKVSNTFIPIDDAYIARTRLLVDFFVGTGAFTEFPEGFEEIYVSDFNGILAD